MKRIILFIILLLSVCSAYAQDIITKKDGTDIKAKIYEVGLKEVKYKNYSNLDGPMHVIAKSDILIVRYENGENEIFKNTESNVVAGMRYRDYKDFYNTREYVRQPGDPYNPFWIGFADFFIPGLGNAITGEWGRAAGFFCSNLGLSVLGLTQIKRIENSTGTSYRFQPNTWYWVIMAARIGLNVWGICDAVHVSKVKNMYNQDLRSQMSSLDLHLEPYFSYTPVSTSGVQPVTGLSLKLNF